jgi:RNA polymerase sigma-70 factor (ECF subfamily)
MVESAPHMQAPDRPPAPPPVLGRVAAGDAVAIRECLARYGGLVWSIARRFDQVDAEDAVQEIFLDLWKSAARFDETVASETAFVAMIARRRLIDRRRMRRRRPTTEQLPDIPVHVDPAASPATCAEAHQAAKALDALRPEQRQVLVLSTCHGLSHGEIAEATGMPLGTVKAHARRGLLSIRAALSGVDQGDGS